MLLLALCLSLHTYAILPAKIYAPYVDVMLWPTFDLMSAYNATGQKYYTLAFIIAGTDGQPAWGGALNMDSDHMVDQISELRSVGGDVIISFGGANGSPIASTITDVNELVTAYESVITKYNVSWIDFDIEGWWVQDEASIDCRNEAAAILQANHPDLRITYCLPVMPYGLTTDGETIIQKAITAGVDIYGVNVMAMDYGQSNQTMGAAAISAAENTHQQTGLSIGITPMIGQNDTQNEIFTLENASEVLNFAQSTSWVNMLAMWSVNRDNGDCAGTTTAAASCSGISQSEFEFTSIFLPYSGDGNEDDENDDDDQVYLTVYAGGTYSGYVNSPVTFTGSASGGTSPYTYSWNFGDGSTGSGNSTSYSYSTAGTYTVTLSVADASGLSASTSTTASIQDTNDDEDDSDNTCWTEWASGAYSGGAQVSYNGINYQAKWWTNSVPGEDDTWQNMGSCSATSTQNTNVDESDTENDKIQTGDIRAGEMTYYGPESGDILDVPGNAGGYTAEDLQSYENVDFCALYASDILNENLMGGCIEIISPSGNKTKCLIVDKLPSGNSGDVDIYGKETFAKLEDPDLGRIDIQWQIVELPTTENIQYRFQSGSNEWWAALQIFKHKYPIAKVEYKNENNEFTEMTRQSNGSNFFIASGMGNGPFTIRLTDYFGNILVHDGIIMQSSERQEAESNFKAGSSSDFLYQNETSYTSLQCFPNPASNFTKIKYEIFKTSDIKLAVYDIYGKELIILEERILEPGSYQKNFDISSVPSGLYFIRLSSNEDNKSEKLLINN